MSLPMIVPDLCVLRKEKHGRLNGRMFSILQQEGLAKTLHFLYNIHIDNLPVYNFF